MNGQEQLQDLALRSQHWEHLWETSWDAREAMYVGEAHLSYWELRAEDFTDGRKACDWNFGRSVASVLKGLIPERSTILDVGAGPGSLAIPFALAGHQVTAVEPASKMLEQLQSSFTLAELPRCRVLSVPWQNIDVDGMRQSFDLVIASQLMWMFRDVWSQLKRLEIVSRNICCVVGGAGADPGGHGTELWHTIMGTRPKPTYSEHPMIFNLLYTKGRKPDVRIISYETERSVKSKINQQKLFYAKYTRLTPEHESLIESAVEASAEHGLVREYCKASVVFWKPAKEGGVVCRS